MADFFVSYNKADRSWAEWIAWQLEDAEYSTILQAWDFRPGSNFVLEMQKASAESSRTLAVLSPDYLDALFTQPEWAAAFARDPTGRSRKLVLVKVRECRAEGLLPQITHINLTGMEESRAKEALLSGVRAGRAKPATPPVFPGIVSQDIRVKPPYPGSSHPAMVHSGELSRFEIVLDSNGHFVDESDVRATLVEAFDEFEAAREASIEVIAEPLRRLVEEVDKRKDAQDMTAADREELVEKRRRIRSIEAIVQSIVWCLNVAVRDGSRWHFGRPEKLLAIADQIVAKLIPRSSSRSNRETLRVDVFRRDYSCTGSFKVLPEEAEALLTTIGCNGWIDFVNFHRGWNPIDELPTIVLPVAFTSMVLAVHRHKGPNRQNIELSLKDGDNWGFGPG
jgi:hypothetical protein